MRSSPDIVYVCRYASVYASMPVCVWLCDGHGYICAYGYGCLYMCFVYIYIYICIYIYTYVCVYVCECRRMTVSNMYIGVRLTLVHSSVRSFVRSSVRWFVRSSVRSFVRSSVRWCVCQSVWHAFGCVFRSVSAFVSLSLSVGVWWRENRRKLMVVWRGSENVF